MKNFLRKIKFILGSSVAIIIITIIKKIYPKDKIITNIFWGSIGHLTIEYDFFLLKINSMKNPIKVFLFSNIHPNNRVLFDNNKYVRFFILNNFIFYFIDKILIKYKKLFFDCALSSCITHFTLETKPRLFEDVWKQYSKYYVLKKKKKLNFFRRINFNNKSLINFLSENNVTKKYAVIHIKTLEGNSCALRTDPLTYIDTIEYLKKNNFNVIFAGREKMPNLFKKFDVVNYSEWTGANFSNDLQLISNSSFVLSFASGFSNIPDLFEIPSVYCGSWHLTVPLFSSSTIFLPALLNYKNGKRLKFKEQVNMFLNNGNNNFSREDVIVVNPSSYEILETTRQALEKITINLEKNDAKIFFKKNFGKHPIYYSEVDISEIFLKNNIDRF